MIQNYHVEEQDENLIVCNADFGDRLKIKHAKVVFHMGK